MNRDPIADYGGLNLFRFSRNEAVNRWDYLGTCDGSPLDGNGTLVSGWDLIAFDWNEEASDYIFFVTEAYVGWEARCEVRCCCSDGIIRTLTGTKRKAETLHFQGLGGNTPNDGPISVPAPNPTKIPDLLGELLGEAASGALPKIRHWNPGDQQRLADAILASRPSSCEEGQWFSEFTWADGLHPCTY